MNCHIVIWWLMENLTKEIIENTLKFKRNPKYRTGKEFYSNLKLFLSAVYMNEYEFFPRVSKIPYEYSVCFFYERDGSLEDLG